MSAGNKDPQFQKLKLYVEPAGNGLAQVRDQFFGPMTMLMAIVGILLLIACANIAGLLLVRGFAREQEMALRISLGVGRYGLVRQVLTESVLLSFIGAAIGIILAKWGVDALVRAIMSARLPEPISIQIETDWHVLLFTTTTALLTGVVFGLAPALHALQLSPASSLRQVGRAGETKSGRSLGKSLLITQVALSMVLLSGAALFTKQLSKLRYEDLGFQRDSVLLVGLDPSRSGLKRAQLSVPYKEMLAQFKTIPGVLSVTFCNGGPIQGGGEAHFVKVEGFQEIQEARRYVMFSRVAPRYFETLGMTLISGRDFEFEDEGRSRVAIINEAMAHRYFGTANPLSKHFTFDGDQQTYEIVGIANDAKYSDLNEAAPPTIYLNAFQGSRMSAQTVALRTNGAYGSVVSNLRQIVSDTARNIAVDNVTTLGAQIDASIVPERLITALAEFFGCVGALLSVLGVYGLVAYNVTRRINEFGVRKALGATRFDVIRMVLRGVFGSVGIGVIIGSVIVFWSKRFTTSFIAVQVDDASPIAFAAAAMIGVTMLAAILPARRAARLEPMDALRHE
jgi:predicted permease